MMAIMKMGNVIDRNVSYLSITARGDKMKEAKTEADKIIAAYRSEMEADYQASLAKVNKSNPLHLQELYNRCIDRSFLYDLVHHSLRIACLSV
jgi:hypothetical protein